MIAGLGLLVVASVVFGALTEPMMGVGMFVSIAVAWVIYEIVERWL